MAEIFTADEVATYMRHEVDAAGGARKWLRKHRMLSEAHIIHMIEDGTAATIPRFLSELGFRQIVRYEAIDRSHNPSK
jgi:hypothetical protein